MDDVTKDTVVWEESNLKDEPKDDPKQDVELTGVELVVVGLDDEIATKDGT